MLRSKDFQPVMIIRKEREQKDKVFTDLPKDREKMLRLLTEHKYMVIPKLTAENFYELCYRGRKRSIEDELDVLNSIKARKAEEKSIPKDNIKDWEYRQKRWRPSRRTYDSNPPRCLIFFGPNSATVRSTAMPLRDISDSKEYFEEDSNVQMGWISTAGDQKEFVDFFRDYCKKHYPHQTRGRVPSAILLDAPKNEFFIHLGSDSTIGISTFLHRLKSGFGLDKEDASRAGGLPFPAPGKTTSFFSRVGDRLFGMVQAESFVGFVGVGIFMIMVMVLSRITLVVD